MGKRKKQTKKPKRITTEVKESVEVTFEEFERTVTKVVRSEGIKDKPSKDKRKSR